MRGVKYWIFGSLLVLICSCNREGSWDCFKTTGEEITDTRFVDFFDQIEIKDKISLELVQDSLQFIEVIGGENIIPKVSTEVVDRILRISNENTCNPVRSFKREIIVRVHTNNLSRIYSESVKNIASVDTLFFPHLTFEAFNAVGVFEIKLKGNFSCYVHSGAIDINVSGSSDSTYVFNAGLGFINCSDLKTSYFHLNHNSTGDAHIFCNGELNIENEGVGNIYYKGVPTSIEVLNPLKENIFNE